MNKRSFFIIAALIIGLIFALADVSALVAQESSTDEFTLEEITVTAAKRVENQQKVAIAMETITSDQMKETGMNNLDEILNNVSNVIINKAQDGLRVTIRGMSDVGESQHGMSVTMPTVAVNVDGVYSNRKDTGSGLFDMERVEVLYGPQSTLYASNSPGGIVNVVTANPKLDMFQTAGTVEAGNYSLLHTEGSVNIPVSEKWALRGAFSTNVRDGFLSNGGDNEDSKSLRLKALYQAGDKLSFVLTGELSKTSTQRSGGVDSFYNGYYEDGTKVDNYWFTDDVLPAPSEDTNKKMTGRMDLDMGFSTLSLVPSYSARTGHREERMEFGADVTLNIGDSEATEKSVEMRMASASDFFFKWIAGVNYYNSKNEQFTKGFDDSGNPKMSTLTSGETIQEYRDMASKEIAKAIFANVTYPVVDTFRVTAGYRQSWDNVVMNNNETRGVMGGAPGRVEEQVEEFEDDYGDPDYKFGVEYDLGTNSMLYADYSTSYRVQAMGGGGPGTGGKKKEPEKLKAYTVGAKNRFLQNKLQVNASAYYYDYQNFSAGDMVMGYYGGLTELTFDSNATQPDPNSSQTGDGRMIGVDISANMIISANDMLNLSVSYLKSEWTDLVFDYEYDYMVQGVGPGQPFTLDNLIPADTVSYNGKPMTMSPPWTITAAYSHNFNLSNGGMIKAQADGRYKTAYRMSWKNSGYPWNYQEDCYIANFSAAYTHSNGLWTISGYVKNITDYAEKRMYMSPGGGAGITTLGNPRTYGAVLSVNF